MSAFTFYIENESTALFCLGLNALLLLKLLKLEFLNNVQECLRIFRFY